MVHRDTTGGVGTVLAHDGDRAPGPVFVLATDACGRILLARGRATRELISLAPEAATGLLLGSLPRIQPTLAEAVARALHGVATTRVLACGSESWKLTAQPLGDGGEWGCLAVVQEATEEVWSSQDSQQARRLLEAIRDAQARFILDENPAPIFDALLVRLLELTGSSYGFIGEVIAPAIGPKYLKTYAITNIAWDDATRALYDEQAARGLEFRNLETLFGAVLKTGQPVVSNVPGADPRRGGLPPGHPPLESFLGLPFFHTDTLVGMLGIANRPGGYDDSIIDSLEPFLTTCAALVQGYRMAQSRREAERDLREREARLRTILDSAAEGILTIDERGVIESVNPAAEEIFGYAAGALVGRNVSTLMPLPDRQQHDSYLRRYLETGVARIIGAGREVAGMRQDGTTFPLDLTVSAVPLADRRLFTGIVRDATERKEVEARLIEADRRKDEFLAMLGHELRNPLSSLSNGLHLLKRPDLPGGVEQRTLEVMEQQLRTLTRLVDDLLDVSRITQGKIRLQTEPMELVAEVHRAVETLRPKLDARGHVLELDLPTGPIIVEADPVRIHQVLTNLLHNAAKYTDPGGRIGAIVEREGDRVVIRVRDNGIGMEPAILTGIFDLFTQAPQSLDRARGGLGIGLTLVRSLIELHGGSITAHSAGPGQGSEFVVHLPVRELADQPRMATADGTTTVAGPLRILLIDDDRLGSELLVRVLQFWGHVVTVVHDGAAALEAFQSGRPDLVLCDLGLPEMDGFAVARALRHKASDWTGSQPRLVALTGYGQDEDRRRSLEAGFDHHLTKPVDLAMLRELLGGSRGRRGHED